MSDKIALAYLTAKADSLSRSVAALRLLLQRGADNGGILSLYQIDEYLIDMTRRADRAADDAAREIFPEWSPKRER